jgi:Tol biopolymer transport system component
MGLTAGDRLGRYEIRAPLGAGGMGEVYRAYDGRLERDVAIKVLPENVAEDDARLARFEREAKLLGSLNHQNIAGLHGLEEHEGWRFLVLELAEGETLADRIARGPIPVDDALEIARQIAGGLEAAHGQGIIHRDLKPANVMLSPAGGVKILDFGLAKAWQAEDSDGDLSRSPTLTAQMTAAGVLLGTAAYMSPEQARGRPVDRRADLWAFGCMLYEMLTGRRLFGGDTVSDVVAAVLKGEVDLGTVPPDTPPPVRRLLGRCLRRDPARRLRDAGDAILELEEQEESSIGAAPQRRVGVRLGGWAVACAAIVVAGALAWRLTTAWEPRETVTAEIVPPAGTEFVFNGDMASPPVMSPDGAMVVFGAAAPGNPVSLWVRSLRTRETRQLPGTEGGFAPFWSPDGRSIGFFDLTALRRVDLAGGSPLTLCPAGIGRGGVWTGHGDIIFSPDYNAGLHVIPAIGGEVRQLTAPIQGRHTSHRWPALLPDGERLVYLAISHASRQSEDNELRIMGIDGRDDRSLVPSLANGVVAAGRLLFMKERALMAQRLDARRGVLTGEPFIVARDVYQDPDTWHGAFSAVGDTLLYQASPDRLGAGVTLLDLEGTELGTVGEASFYGAIDASPDGRHVAVSIGSPSDIWIIDLETGRRSRLTFDPASATSPLWSADGSEIFYRSFDAENPSRILAKPSSGAGDPRVVLDDPDLLLQPADVSPDGRYLILEDAYYAVGADIWVLDLEGEGPPMPLIEQPGTQTQVSISPDGRWVVYWSDESGGLQGYVEPFLPEPLEVGTPARSGRWEVSAETAGGSPHWSSDGAMLLYLTLDRRLVAVDVDIVGDTVRVGERRVIGQTNASSSLRAWDVVPGADRIVLINQPPGAGTPITAVIGLRRLLAGADH